MITLNSRLMAQSFRVPPFYNTFGHIVSVGLTLRIRRGVGWRGPCAFCTGRDSPDRRLHAEVRPHHSDRCFAPLSIANVSLASECFPSLLRTVKVNRNVSRIALPCVIYRQSPGRGGFESVAVK